MWLCKLVGHKFKLTTWDSETVTYVDWCQRCGIRGGRRAPSGSTERGEQ